MCSRVIPHLNRRKFLKLNKIKRTTVKSKRLKKKALDKKLRFTQTKVPLWEEPRLMSKLVKASTKVSRKINTGADDSYTQDFKHSLHEARERIESILLTRLHDLLSPNLSKNATRQLLKKTALEIAANFGVPRRKFKGTNKWLDTFLKHNELLGYCVSVNSVHADVKEKPKIVASNKKLDASVNLDILKPDEDIPDLYDLFTFPKAYNPPEVKENTAKNNRKADSRSRLCIIRENVLSEDEILRHKDSQQWIGPSIFPKYCHLERIGFNLGRCNKDSLNDCDSTLKTHEVSSIYDELFVASQRFNVTEIDKNPCSTSSSGDSDSGYRSRSESKNDERQSNKCPITCEKTLEADSQLPPDHVKTSEESQTFFEEPSINSNLSDFLSTSSLHSVTEDTCADFGDPDHVKNSEESQTFFEEPSINSNRSDFLPTSSFHSVTEDTTDPLFFFTANSPATSSVDHEQMDFSANELDELLNLFNGQDPPELQNVQSVNVSTNISQNELVIADEVDLATSLVEDTNVLDDSAATFPFEGGDELMKAFWS